MSDLNERLETMRKGKKRKALFRLTVFTVIVLLTLVSSFASYRYVSKSMLEEDTQTAVVIEPGSEIKVDIPLGSGTSAIAEILKKNEIIKYPGLFKFISKINGYDGTYKSGTHMLGKELSYTDLMRVLSDKPLDNPNVKVTIPEGKTFNEVVQILDKSEIIDKNKFVELAEKESFEYKFVKDIPKNREFRLQGYLFPETYFFDKDGGEEEILNKLLGQFDKIFTDEREKRAKELGMTIDEVITLASIIEREAVVSEERPRIAGVFYNRLKSKDPTLRKLQSCASIQYIFLQNTGKIKERILNEDTRIDHPYNTYVHEGLPPGPICCPGEDAINAALYPEENDYMYFVAKEDGTKEHYFSKTYKEHLNAQAKAQKNLK